MNKKEYILVNITNKSVTSWCRVKNLTQAKKHFNSLIEKNIIYKKDLHIYEHKRILY